MYEVVYVIFKQLVRLCWRLLPVYCSAALGGLALFQFQQHGSWLWLAIPIGLVGVTVCWLRQQR